MKIRDFITGLFIMLFVGLMLTSCRKDDYCHCGEVRSYYIQDGQYLLVVKNECTSNYDTFSVSRSVWMSKFEGDIYCSLTNGEW